MDGIRVYPAALDSQGNDLIHGHADHWQADVVLILYDAFAMNGLILRQMTQHVVIWQPVDCEPMSRADLDVFKTSGAQPVAMSKFGERMMTDEGLEPLYAPHGIDTALFSPVTEAERTALREEEKIPADAFLFGMNVHNKDADRKAIFEQMTAFALFSRRHDDALLLCHTMPHPVMSGNDLIGMADFLGIGKKVCWADPYSLLAGEYTQADMANWYRKLDLYTGASRGEGFGIPLIEAQACGVPVATNDASAMTELAGPGWLVTGQPYWHKGHKTTWITPDIGQLVEVYEEAYDGGAAARSRHARAFARQYDADVVYAKHWSLIVADLETALADDGEEDSDDESGVPLPADA